MVKETKFKQTEIGMIPEDWKVEKIKDISSIKTGSKNTQDRIENGAYPFFVRSQTIERINSYSFNGEAVLTAGDGVGVGKVFHYLNEKFDFHQRVYAIYNFRNDVSGFYFFKYFQNNFFGRVMQMTAKSSVDSVRMETISEMQIPLPPFAEQGAIATALSDCDAWIDSIEQVLAKKRLIKQGAMQELLTPPCYPELPEKSGQAVEGWEVKKLGEMTTLITKGTTPTSVGYDFTGNGINFIKVESVNKKGAIDLGKAAFISEECHQLLNRSQIKTGDILFSIAGALGRTAIVKENICPANTNQALGIIRLKEGVINTKYLYYFFNKNDFQLMLNTISVTGAQPNLSLQNLNEFDIVFPSLSEQTRIATILSDMDVEIEALEEKLQKARQIKQGMMQELLTGKTRLLS